MKMKIFSAGVAALLLAAGMPCPARAIDKGQMDPAKMSEPELLAQVRQLTEEKFELTQFAVGKATTDKVKQFAQRLLQHAQQIDTKLNDLAATGNVSAANKDNLATPDEVTDVERMQGAAVDTGYVKAMLHLSQSLVPFYEQLSARAGNARLKSFAHDSLASERSQIKELEAL